MALSLIKAALVKAEGKWWFVFTADEKRFEELKRLVTSGREIKGEELKQYGGVALVLDCEDRRWERQCFGSSSNKCREQRATWERWCKSNQAEPRFFDKLRYWDIRPFDNREAYIATVYKAIANAQLEYALKERAPIIFLVAEPDFGTYMTVRRQVESHLGKSHTKFIDVGDYVCVVVHRIIKLVINYEDNITYDIDLATTCIRKDSDALEIFMYMKETLKNQRERKVRRDLFMDVDSQLSDMAEDCIRYYPRQEESLPSEICKRFIETWTAMRLLLS